MFVELLSALPSGSPEYTIEVESAAAACASNGRALQRRTWQV